MTNFEKYMHYRSEGGMMSFEEWKTRRRCPRYTTTQILFMILLAVALVAILASCAVRPTSAFTGQVVSVSSSKPHRYEVGLDTGGTAVKVLYGTCRAPRVGDSLQVQYMTGQKGPGILSVIKRVK